VLALLLVQPNRFVPTDAFTEEIWQQNPPPSALATLQTYIYQLRKVLGQSEPWKRESIIQTRIEPSGYVLRIDPKQIDLYHFEELVAQGRQLLAESQFHLASKTLHEALQLWHGPAPSSLGGGPILQAHAIRLEESRIDALELRIEADLRMGRHRELVSELRTLVATHPLRESFHAKLMVALHSSARRAEALQVYQSYRRMLREELGLEPNLDMQNLQRRILTAGSLHATPQPMSAG
jgi:DNA-binding SARP family transcriptional activator